MAAASERIEPPVCEHVREWARKHGKALTAPTPSCPWCGDEGWGHGSEEALDDEQ